MIAFIREGAEKLDFDKMTLSQLHLACEEVLVNIINYAYPDKEGSIEINCKPGQEQLRIEIVDSGIPFRPLDIPEPDINLPLEERSPGGLGIFMMRKIMDQVSYTRDQGRNILTMAKGKQP